MTRPSKHTPSQPLRPQEFQSLFEHGYSSLSRRFFAENLTSDPQSTPEQISAVLSDTNNISQLINTLDHTGIAILHYVAQQGGRIRGESLRKELLLHGHGERTDTLAALLQKTLLIPIPSSGTTELDIPLLLAGNGFLQHELAITQTTQEVLAQQDAYLSQNPTAWEGVVERSWSSSFSQLELNLLHLGMLLTQNTLRLNKSGAPNRRSLAKFTDGVLPPSDHEVQSLSLQNTQDLDFLAFLFAVGVELDIFTVGKNATTLIANANATHAHFTQPIETRIRKLADGLKNIKQWSESLSVLLDHAPDDDRIVHQQLSCTESNGTILIGARGYVLSVLRRAQIHGWTTIEALVDLCEKLDRDYLPRVLSKTGENLPVREYIQALIERPLLWSGAVELGYSQDGEKLVRLTNHGLHLLRSKHVESPELTPQDQHVKCLLVQPNFEATVFLDHAPMKVILQLYEVGYRSALADRVATFKLDAESVQRGYSSGLDAELVISTLNTHSHIPLDPSIEFQLRDWERLWKRLTLYADGVIFRHEDPDLLDVIVSKIQHALRDKPLVVEKLAPSAVFLNVSESWDEIAKILQRHKHITFNYLGDIPPSLNFVEPLIFEIDPLRCDLLTLHEIPEIATHVRSRFPSSTQRWRLSIESIREKWPQDPLSHVLRFLSARTIGGLPPEQHLKLISVLEQPPELQRLQGVEILAFDQPHTTSLFCSIPEVESVIISRLGELSFAFASRDLPVIQEQLQRIGLEASLRSF